MALSLGSQIELLRKPSRRGAASTLATLIVFWVGAMPREAPAHPGLHEELADVTVRIDAGRATSDDYLERAELHRLECSWDAAREDFDRAAELDPGSDAVALGRAALLLDEGRAVECEAALGPPLDAHPLDVRALELRARARGTQGRPADAAADFDRLIAVVPRPSPDHFVRRARWLEEAGPAHWEEALRGIEEGIARLGLVPGLVIEASEIEARLGRFTEAKERLARFAAAAMAIGAGRGAGAAVPRSAAGLATFPDRPVPRPGPPGEPGEPVVTRGPYLQRGSQDQVVVRWRTNGLTDGRVRYGVSPDHLDHVVDDAVPSTEHELTLTGLSPDTRYAYTVGPRGPIADGEQTVATFKTPPLPGAREPTRLWVVGDCGNANSNVAAVRDAYEVWAADRPADLWLMLGDNAYPAGTDAQYQAAVFNMFAPMLSRSVLWPTRGNHDLLGVGGTFDYYDIFTLPSAGECGGLPSGTEAYYAFDWADIHFVCLDSEGSNRSRSGPMMRWLESDLAVTAQPWIIAFWHHPPYSHGAHNSDDSGESGGRLRDMRENALGILDSAGVDLVLTGHSHSYERSFLLRGHYDVSSTLTAGMILDAGDGVPGGDGPYEKASAGKGPLEGVVYAVAGNSGQLTSGPLDHPVMVTSMLTLGSMVIDVDGDRLDGRFLDAQGVVRDSFAIVKGVGVTGVSPAGARGGPTLAIRSVEPNPVAERATFRYALPRAARAGIRVVDVAGRLVRTLVDRDEPAGVHTITWDGRDAGGSRVAAGAYFAVLAAGGERRAARFAVVR